MSGYFLFTAMVIIVLSYRVSKGHIMRRNMRIFLIPGVLFLVSSYMILEKHKIDRKMIILILIIDFIMGIVGGILLIKATKLRVLDNGQIFKDGGLMITLIFVMYLVVVVLISDRVIGNDVTIEIKIASLIMTLGIQFLVRDFYMAIKLDKIYGIQ